MTGNLFSIVIPVLLIGIIGLVVGVVIGVLINSAQKSSRPPVSDADGAKLPVALQVWHDPHSHKLAIEYDGSVFHSANKLTADQKTKLAELFSDLRFWLGLGAPAAPSERLQQVTSDLPQTKTASSDGQVLITRAANEPTISAKPVREAPKTIAGQIDEILQEILPQTEMRDRGIRLMELPGRGMVVLVDGKSYEGVGDVPDAAVRELIQSCVVEWENRG